MLRVLVITLALTALACSRPGSSTGGPGDGTGAAAGMPKQGGTFTLALRRDPPSAYDRMMTNIWYEITPITSGVYGNGNVIGLCRDDFFKICPYLAESWEANSDSSQWTFKIRDGVKWQDGTAFSAEDVKYWMEMVLGKAGGGGKTRRRAAYVNDYEDVKNVEVLDGNRVRVTLQEARPLFLQLISRSVPGAVIAHPKHLAEPRIKAGEVDVSPQDLGFVGHGPFTMVKQEKGVGAEIKRWDGYWEKDGSGNQLPYLDRVRFAVIPDPAAMDAAFRTGKLDGGSYGAGHTLSKERKDTYAREMGDKVYFVPIYSSNTLLSFNTLIPGPQADVRVRQAVSLTLDRQEAAKALGGGEGSPTITMSPENPFSNPNAINTWPGWNPATKQADRERAKQLMREAGYTNGFTVKTFCYNVRTYTEVCEYLNAQLAPLGINYEFEIGDQAAYTQSRQSLEYPMVTMPGVVEVIDPELTEPNVGRFSEFNSAGGKHEDPKVPAYFKRMRESKDLAQKTEIWREFERYYFLEQVYATPIYIARASTPYRSYVQGILRPTSGTDYQLDLAVVWMDK